MAKFRRGAGSFDVVRRFLAGQHKNRAVSCRARQKGDCDIQQGGQVESGSLERQTGLGSMGPRAAGTW